MPPHALLLLSLIIASTVPAPVRADGCFVWNKAKDINEPTQKAIIVYDAGREDIILQVKYEGSVADFGWLIPVPSLPTVEKGSMDCFYELSKLSQEHFEAGLTKGGVPGGVNVVEIKTVGAYEVAILSPSDAGSLDQWLRTHGYAVPGDQAGILDEYTRKGWYFIAAKIQLDRGPDF